MSQGPGLLERALDRVSGRGETPLVFCIDVEPDTRVFDRADPPPWAGFERLMKMAPALRERLSEATGKPAAFTWFLRMDPQVAGSWGSPTWAAERYEDLFAELSEQGDELGVHTHTWRWDSQADDWVAYYDDPAWAEHCLTMGLDAFEEAFGRSCAAHRGGDHFLNGAMLSVMESRGVKIDLTVEPGLPPLGANKTEADHGLCPDYRGTPAKPYRSSPDRFPDADLTSRANPLLVPLLSAPRRRPPFRRSPLYPWDEEGLKSFGQRLAVELLRKPPIIAAAVRSDEVLAPPHWAKVTEYLEHLAGYRQMEFTTASRAADRFESQGAAAAAIQ